MNTYNVNLNNSTKDMKVVAFNKQGIGFDIFSLDEWKRLIFHSTHKRRYRTWKFVSSKEV